MFKVFPLVDFQKVLDDGVMDGWMDGWMNWGVNERCYPAAHTS